MAETSTPHQLLIVAIQDLHDAERAWLERLPALRESTAGPLADYIVTEELRSRHQAERLEAIASRLGAPASNAPNIWLRAVLDDADRDAATIAHGTLRDIALTGAFRKGKQSERVSYETALGLAEALGDRESSAALARARDEEAEADETLAALLAELLQPIA